ncbi:MAG: hypothetical protein LBP59_07845 [Planctomycetaceae bacterium]|nr:hypothetical protein [Planctomycetaceae bacterium]
MFLYRFAGETPASQDRGRLACMRLYSTANERDFDLKCLFVCLSANSRRDARDPLVSPAFQDRGHFVCVPSDSQAKRLHPRIAGGTPAFQDRGRLACMRLYSTANERGLDRNNIFVCLSANSRRDACDPVQFFVTKNCLICPSCPIKNNSEL